MSDTAIEARPARPKADDWGERIAAQQRSGMSVKQFCREQGLTEYSSYAWRKRLREQGPVRFALVERSARQQERTAEVALGRLFRCFTRDGEVSDPTGATGSVDSLARP